MQDKRAHQRTAYTVPVDVALSTGESYTAQSRDISLGGTFLETERVLPVGAAVTVKLELPGLGACALPGYVRWLKQGGYGIQFGLLGARETHAIGKLVRTQDAGERESKF